MIAHPTSHPEVDLCDLSGNAAMDSSHNSLMIHTSDYLENQAMKWSVEDSQSQQLL